MLIPPVGAKRELGDGATCGLRTVRVRKSRPGLGSAAILLAEMISAGPVRLGFSTGSDVVSTVTGGNSMAASRSVKSTLRRWPSARRSEEHTSELQSLTNLVCRLLLEKKKHGKRM